MTDSVHTYDVAVSFAGAQRGLVEPVVRACEAAGVTVFYDRDRTVEFWGRNLVSAYPMDEFNAAMSRAIEVGIDSYILPILIAERVGVARERHQEPREVTSVVREALEVRLPWLPTVDFSQYETLESALVRVGELFRQAATELAPFGLRCVVRLSDSAVEVRVERQGNPMCGLRLRFDESSFGGGDRLVMAFAWPRIAGDGFQRLGDCGVGPDSRQPRLRFVEPGRGRDSLVTADELFHLLWANIVEYVEKVR